jgi:hypothetical protein
MRAFIDQPGNATIGIRFDLTRKIRLGGRIEQNAGELGGRRELSDPARPREDPRVMHASARERLLKHGDRLGLTEDSLHEGIVALRRSAIVEAGGYASRASEIASLPFLGLSGRVGVRTARPCAHASSMK